MPGDLTGEVAYLLTLPVDPETRRVRLPEEQTLSVWRAIALSQVEKALQGDARAAALVRELAQGTAAPTAAQPTLESLLRLLEEQGL